MIRCAAAHGALRPQAVSVVRGRMSEGGTELLWA